MRYEETEKLTEEPFLWLAGVKKAVFGKMLAVLHTAYALRNQQKCPHLAR